MMYFVYILYNLETDRYYIGYTSDLKRRITEHNKGNHNSKFTRKQKGTWKIVYFKNIGT